MARKKSEFIQDTTVANTATIDFVINGVNRKMTIADLAALLGVTGTIQAQGSVTGTPILNTVSDVHNIRTLEDGQGVKASVSPEGGATLEHNLIAGTTGTPVLVDNLNKSTLIRNMLAGSGMSISVVGESIQFVASGTPAASNIVVVNEMSDFPADVGGVITLADDTGYLVSAALTTANRFVLGDNTLLFGSDSSVSSITYTGANTMFTSTDGSQKITLLALMCSAGQLFDISSSGAGVFQFVNNTVVACDTVGTFTNLSASQITDNAFINIISGGLTFVGTMELYVGVRNIFSITAGDVFDLGTCVFNSGWTMETSFVTLAAGTSFLKGLASSGNMGAGALGTLLNSRFTGAGTPLDTITTDDVQWQFSLNDTIKDTRPDGLLSADGPFTVPIAAANTPVKIGVATDWIVERVSQISGDDSGTLTFNGTKDATMPITANLSAEPASGTNKDLTFYIAKNSTVIPNSAASTTVSSGGPKNTPVPWQDSLTDGDTIEVWVENNTDTTDVVINTGILRLN